MVYCGSLGSPTLVITHIIRGLPIECDTPSTRCHFGNATVRMSIAECRASSSCKQYPPVSPKISSCAINPSVRHSWLAIVTGNNESPSSVFYPRHKKRISGFTSDEYLLIYTSHLSATHGTIEIFISLFIFIEIPKKKKMSKSSKSTFVLG